MNPYDAATHRTDLTLGEGKTCARCGWKARGAAQIGEDTYCHPSCSCHPDCYRFAVIRNSGNLIFDDGGTLEPGLNMIRNDLGKPEPIMRTRSGWDDPTPSPINDILASMAYIRKHYEGTPEQKRAAKEHAALVNAMQPQLKAAIDAYKGITQLSGIAIVDVTRQDELIARLATMHGPSRGFCSICDDERWPCDTATEIATDFGVDLTDAHLYRWDTE